MVFSEILTEAMKFLFKHGKLLAYINIITLLYSVYFMFIILSTDSWTTDLFVNQNSFSTITKSFTFSHLPVHIKEQLRFVIALLLITYFVYFNIMLFSVPATILASFTSTYCTYSDSLSIKDLLLKLMQQLMRLSVTWLYITLFDVAYTVTAWVLLFSLVPKANHSSIPVVVVFFLALFISLYLEVVWTLGAVASAIEEKIYGMEAFSKAAQLVKGRKLTGFALNNFFMSVYVVVYQFFKIIQLRAASSSRIMTCLLFLLVINSLCLVKMLKLIAYAVFYYQLKKSHGEEIELQRGMGYGKMPTSSSVP